MFKIAAATLLALPIVHAQQAIWAQCTICHQTLMKTMLTIPKVVVKDGPAARRVSRVLVVPTLMTGTLNVSLATVAEIPQPPALQQLQQELPLAVLSQPPHKVVDRAVHFHRPTNGEILVHWLSPSKDGIASKISLMRHIMVNILFTPLSFPAAINPWPLDSLATGLR
jgi:hypothetical protein